MTNNGLRYSGGKPRWDLLPPDAMFELVRIYTRGAEKYTRKFKNRCEGLWNVVNAKNISLYLAGICVANVTRNGSEIIIQSLPIVKEEIEKNGVKNIPKNLTKLENWIELEEIIGVLNESYQLNTKNGSLILKDSILPKKPIITCVKQDALSAVQENFFTLITTIPQGNLEEYCVVNAITVWDSLEITFQVLKEHLNISGKTTLLEISGDRNWEKGMRWGEMIRALKSHLNKWEMGITFDDELTDCRHIAMVAWNALALLAYELRGTPGDDRVKSLVADPKSFYLSDSVDKQSTV